uniref:Uncharacterized protein n=1 Tax=Anguilla anguilla TaxID=7936 RepID=A0A0E9V1K2_ANGAN
MAESMNTQMVNACCCGPGIHSRHGTWKSICARSPSTYARFWKQSSVKCARQTQTPSMLSDTST